MLTATSVMLSNMSPMCPVKDYVHKITKLPNAIIRFGIVL